MKIITLIALLLAGCHGVEERECHGITEVAGISYKQQTLDELFK